MAEKGLELLPGSVFCRMSFSAPDRLPAFARVVQASMGGFFVAVRKRCTLCRCFGLDLCCIQSETEDVSMCEPLEVLAHMLIYGTAM
eukprot:15335075-Ditylum_brightwellii.AAC.1